MGGTVREGGDTQRPRAHRKIRNLPPRTPARSRTGTYGTRRGASFDPILIPPRWPSAPRGLVPRGGTNGSTATRGAGFAGDPYAADATRRSSSRFELNGGASRRAADQSPTTLQWAERTQLLHSSSTRTTPAWCPCAKANHAVGQGVTSVDTRSVVPPRSRCPLHPVGSTPRAFSSLVNLSSLSCVVRALVGGAAGNGTNGTVRGRWQMDLVWAGLVGVGLGEGG